MKFLISHCTAIIVFSSITITLSLLLTLIAHRKGHRITKQSYTPQFFIKQNDTEILNRIISDKGKIYLELQETEKNNGITVWKQRICVAGIVFVRVENKLIVTCDTQAYMKIFDFDEYVGKIQFRGDAYNIFNLFFSDLKKPTICFYRFGKVVLGDGRDLGKVFVFVDEGGAHVLDNGQAIFNSLLM